MCTYTVCVLLFPKKTSPPCNKWHWKRFVDIFWEIMEVAPYTVFSSGARWLLSKRPCLLQTLIKSTAKLEVFKIKYFLPYKGVTKIPKHPQKPPKAQISVIWNEPEEEFMFFLYWVSVQPGSLAPWRIGAGIPHTPNKEQWHHFEWKCFGC